MGLVVYTAIVGDNGDTLREPLCDQPDDVRLVCFTNRTFRSDHWEVRPLCYNAPTERRTSRWHKVNSHALFPGKDPVIWLDGSMSLSVPATRLVEEALTGHNVLAACKHSERDCIYAEHLACKRMKKDDPEVMQRQIDHYKFLGYPPQNGLAETGCLVRVPDACAAFETAWWEMIHRFSHRDQLSFDFAAWRLNLAYAHVPGRVRKSPYFVYHQHNKRAKRP